MEHFLVRLFQFYVQNTELIDICCLSTQKSEPSSHQNVLYGICTTVVMRIKHKGKDNISVGYESFCDSIHVQCGTRVVWISVWI